MISARRLCCAASVAFLAAMAGNISAQRSRPARTAPETITIGSAGTDIIVAPGPKAPREFRGVWVATVSNIDWPSTNTLSSDKQKEELIAIFDKSKELNLNAIVLQVRPACDALYDSKLEPWSSYLTGQQGKAPEPYYDPLEFAVAEAHKRGLELHCWFNPYRARAGGKKTLADNHISKTHPEAVKEYGEYLWMDPSQKIVQDHSLAVMMDVVRRYDIDGVHMDDYFYPYPVNDKKTGKEIDFPDEPSWNAYVAGGGKLKRDDWRRKSVDDFVHNLYNAVKKEKPWVKVGISPFGIWQPGHPPEIKGFNQYAKLYADAKKWLNEGWVDYFVPQLYWKVSSPGQSYPLLLRWWLNENTQGRHIWPGLYTSKVGEREKGWIAEDILNQIVITRFLNADGNVHFSMKAMLVNKGKLNDMLLSDGVYSKEALVPAYPWLDSKAPGRPTLDVVSQAAEDATTTASASDSGSTATATTSTAGETGTSSTQATVLEGSDAKPEEKEKPKLVKAATLSWTPARGEAVWLWALYLKDGANWKFQTLPGSTTSFDLMIPEKGKLPSEVELSAVDRNGNESPRATAKIEAAK